MTVDASCTAVSCGNQRSQITAWGKSSQRARKQMSEHHAHPVPYACTNQASNQLIKESKSD